MKKIIVLLMVCMVAFGSLSFADSEYYQTDSMKNFEFVERFENVNGLTEYIIIRDLKRSIEIKFSFYDDGEINFENMKYDYDYVNDVLTITDQNYKIVYTDLMIR